MGGRPNHTAGAAILMSALWLAGCQQSATAPDSRHVSDSDLQFITGLTNLVEFDHRVTGSAWRKTADPRVKALADDLVARVDAFHARVQLVAARDGISPPVNMSLFEQSDMHTRVAALMASSRYDFDQEFLSDEIIGNKQVLQQAQDVVREPAGDPELRALVTEAVGRLQENIARLESLQAQMKS
jgi:predicted outer membrane protein